MKAAWDGVKAAWYRCMLYTIGACSLAWRHGMQPGKEASGMACVKAAWRGDAYALWHAGRSCSHSEGLVLVLFHYLALAGTFVVDAAEV